MPDINDYLARQEASRQAGIAIEKAAGRKASNVVQRPVVLSTSFEERADLPPGTLICKMTSEVAAGLSATGFHEPISMRALPDKWWRAYVDLVSLGRVSESGCGMALVTTCSEELLRRYGFYYCEVIAGPFDSEEEANERQPR